MTPKALAKRLQMDEGNISNWKKGKNLPSLEVFYELCKILDVGVDYLLGLDN
ncbi:MAG: helix-turn-helix transcriptional regulator [Clostridia bacterium]|nr:helix-turn-helix transcriptional regulator [Clostridia bacterium]